MFALLSLAVSAGIAILFYDSLFLMILSVPVYIFLTRAKREEYSVRERQRLENQFRDGILSVAASLQAGYSIENSFREAMAEMERLHGEDSPIFREFYVINAKLSVNVALEELLSDFADRSACDDIETFCQVFIFARKSGGSLDKVIKKSAESISGKLELAEDIRTELASRRYESLIMSIMPMFIIGYVRFSTPGYFDCLYHNVPGVLIMTVALAVYGASFLLSEKLLNVGGM